MSDGGIHYEDPFVDPISARSEARRLRGRLPLPVTIWTAGTIDEPVGLTISSLVVAEGEPPVAAGLVAETTDLYETIASTRTFAIHVLRDDDARLAEVFAGLRPSPGGPFAGSRCEGSRWGPLLADHRTRAMCRVVSDVPAGYHRLVTAAIERIDLDDLDSPAVFFRGRFRRLDRELDER